MDQLHSTVATSQTTSKMVEIILAKYDSLNKTRRTETDVLLDTASVKFLMNQQNNSTSLEIILHSEKE